MRFLLSLAAVAAALSGVSAAGSTDCTPKTGGTFGTTSGNQCITYTSATVELVTGVPAAIVLPQFNPADVPANAILDGVYINYIDADYAPVAQYHATADTTNFIVKVSVPASWALFSSVDNFVVTLGAINSLTRMLGSQSVAPSNGDGSSGCVVTQDGSGNSLACKEGTLEGADFQLIDSQFSGAGLTLTPGAGNVNFVPNYLQTGTYKHFVGPGDFSEVGASQSTTGILIKRNTGLTGYEGAGTWSLTTSTAAATGVAAPVEGAFSVQGTSPQVQVDVTQHLLCTAQVQYDFHVPSVAGDPQFAGFQGQSFQVHGAPESYFALISAPNYYVNARFDYLSTGKCDYNETACFTHPGTYMGLIYVGMKDANILVQAGPHSTGFAGVLVNDKPMQVGDRFSMPQLSSNSHIHMVSNSKLNLVLDTITLSIVNSDLFVNFDLALTDKQLLTTGAVPHTVARDATPSQIAHSLNKWYGSYNPLHGLIGQTWRNVKYADNKQYQGDITEYQLDKIVDHTFLYCVYEN